MAGDDAAWVAVHALTADQANNACRGAVKPPEQILKARANVKNISVDLSIFLWHLSA